MKITVNLFACFRTDRFRQQLRDYPVETSLLEVLADIGIRPEEVGMALVNGRHAQLSQALSEGDNLSLFPTLGGG